MESLDELDRRLISALRTNGRAPVAALARELGIARATVSTRLQRLINDGTIAGFSVDVREGSDPGLIRAVCLIEVEGRATDTVIRALRGLRGLESLHTTNGEWDLVAVLSTTTLATFDRLLRDIREIEGVLNSETNLLLAPVLGH